MGNESMRAFEFEGRRRGIRLDEGTWQAIDWLAEQRGVKWAELAREWVTLGAHGPEKDDNLTRIIRSATMQCLLQETILSERADQFGGLQSPGFALAGMADDASFDESLSQAIIEATSDFVGFEISTGIDEFGRVAYWIRNGVRGGSNLILSTPFTPTQWLDAYEKPAS